MTLEKKVNLSELLPDGLKLTSGSSTDLWITVNILPEGSKIYSFPTEDIKVKVCLMICSWHLKLQILS